MTSIAKRLIDALAGQYGIESEIGAGGMATVYLAHDVKHGRKVAVKVLRPEFAEALGADRFLREIEIAASLTHPHILPLHDSGEADGFLYYVMPFIDGESLRERITREGALPIQEVARTLRQVVDVLGEAHARGIVHRDVKPENVLLRGGHALVADFGVAKAVSDAANQHQLTTAGVALGTPQYMAPEQATADPQLDHRADLFAAGAIAYEMLTGVAPFPGDNARAVLTAVLTHTPTPPHDLRPAVPPELSALIMRCLEKDPIQRWQTAGDILGRLDTIVTPVQGTSAVSSVLKTRAGRRAILVAGIAVVAAGSLGAWRWSERRTAVEWARGEAIPEVVRLLGENRLAEAAQLALDAEAIVGSDPILEPLWARMSSPFRITSDPAGASVSFRPYEPGDPWEPLGVTPIESDRFPIGAYRFRIEAEGYEPVEEVRSLIPANIVLEVANSGMDYMTDPSYVIDVHLSEEGTLPDGMVAVTGGLYGTLPIMGYGQVRPTMIPDYLIHRTEVTVEAYQEFVDAGGYAERSLWQEPFSRDGGALSWEEAMAEFTDATGRAGPSTWSLSAPPQGTASLPVGGLSWFEAAAYCRWRGMSLPTIYHWSRATLPSTDVWIPFNPLLARASNFEGVGPEPVASRGAVGVSGAHDLGGNLREWLSTSSRGNRYLVGGAWSDPIYWLHDSFPADPWGREATDGFRCALFPEGEPPEHLAAPLETPEQDFVKEIDPISDAVFETRRSFYDYDHTSPLAASVDGSIELEWGATQEWVTINTAYGDRMPIRLHIPTNHVPPFEAIVFFGGGNVIRSNEMEDPQPPLGDLIRSGRVVVEPAYDGTFQRNDGRTLQRIAQGQEELFANWIKDLGRTLDYLEERPDIDHTRVSFLGISLGAALVHNLLPFEPRFKAAILYSGGFSPMASQPGIEDRIAVASRIRMPILMLGGNSDFNSPITPHQEAYFRAFGTPDEHKFFRVYDAGHWPLPMNDVLRETVDFLNRYAGPS